MRGDVGQANHRGGADAFPPANVNWCQLRLTHLKCSRVILEELGIY